jgi:Fe-S oxidoreductase
VDEPTDHQPAAERRRPPAVAAATRLPPVQEAYADYARHATRCTACRDIEQSCLAGNDLHRTWRVLANAALDQLAARAPSPPRQ